MTDYELMRLEEEEIQKHKFCRSQELGYDIGYEQAVAEWGRNHRAQWLAELKTDERAKASADFMPSEWP